MINAAAASYTACAGSIPAGGIPPGGGAVWLETTGPAVGSVLGDRLIEGL